MMANFFICVFDLPHMSRVNLEPDELHVIYLGTLQYLLGPILFLLVFRVLRGTPTGNMTRVWNAISEAYAGEGTQYNNLTLNSFTEPKTPFLVYPS